MEIDDSPHAGEQTVADPGRIFQTTRKIHPCVHSIPAGWKRLKPTMSRKMAAETADRRSAALLVAWSASSSMAYKIRQIKHFRYSVSGQVAEMG
jgi:hypothetical protein